MAATLVVIALGVMFYLIWGGVRLGGAEEASQRLGAEYSGLLMQLKKDVRSARGAEFYDNGFTLSIRKPGGGGITEEKVSYSKSGRNVIRKSDEGERSFSFANILPAGFSIDFSAGARGEGLLALAFAARDNSGKIIFERSENVSIGR